MKKIFCAAMALCFPLFSAAATVYLCRGYSGGEFWTNTLCSQRNALLIRAVTVPDGMTWDQQVDMAKAAHNQGAQLQNAAVPEPPSTHQRCAQLQAERMRIWSKYENFQYQPPEVIGPDRQRTIAIQAEQRALRCPMQ